MKKENYQFTYLTNDDRAQRLSQSYCVFKGEVVYIEYESNYNFRATNSKRQVFIVDIRDKEFSAVPFSLGWVNHNDRAVYLSRSATRTSRQGMTDRGFHMKEVGGANAVGRVDMLGVLDYAYKGEYPSLTDAIKSIKSNPKVSVAISRDTVLYTDDIGIVKIMFHQETIGWYSRAEGLCRVPDTTKSNWFSKFLSPFGLKVEKGIDL